jgi:hypothetical protein
MMQLVQQHLVHQTDEYTFELDEYRDAEGHQMLLAHLRVHKWTASACKRFKRDWALFRKHIPAPLFATPMEDDPRWVKFVTFMGWRPFSTALCRDGIERPLYIHTV